MTPLDSSISPSRPRLKLKITSAAQSAVRSGHPWVYATSILETNREGEVGELAIIYDKQNAFLAAGLYDPGSPIRVRILHQGKSRRIDKGFFHSTILSAVGLRRDVIKENTSGFRVIHGENDYMPGLVVDRYGKVLVVKIYTASWIPWIEWVADCLMEILEPSSIVLRCSRNVRLPKAQAQSNGPGESCGEVLNGTPINFGGVFRGRCEDANVEFIENGYSFRCDVFKGQKTGFFLDQRENRMRVGMLASGARVINAFSYSGGFSVYAAGGGAVSVMDVDISQHALDAGQTNFELNAGRIRGACTRRGLKADVFDWIHRATQDKADLLIVDPPSMAKREMERVEALEAYHTLAREAVGHLNRNGMLVMASCSAHVSKDEFLEAVRGACQKSARQHRELGFYQHPADHPCRFAEAAYLKCLFIGFDENQQNL